MGAGRAAGLLLVVLLTMHRARADDCGEREYLHEGRCCVFCEAGTFVADHCSASHLRGKCDPCKEGKDFTAHKNGLEGCLPCRQCKEGQITVRPCTLTQNAECQCKPGYFCADYACEICQRHSQMPPDREEITPNCSDTTDPGCGLPSQGKAALAWVIPVVVLLVLVLLVAVPMKLKRCKAASTDKHVEGGLKKMVENNAVSEEGTIPCRDWKCCMIVWLRRVAKPSFPAKPVQNSAFQQNAPSNLTTGTPANCKVQEPKCQITVEYLSQSELTDTFEVSIKEVPL